ncbi:MAG: SDR family NAD(P)-dependent oxidoreductase [Pirellulaceae bacterium]
MATAPPWDDFARLDGKTAVVTGASSGIGRAIAGQLAAAGADLVVHTRARRAELERVAVEIRAQGRQAHVVVGDLAEDLTQTRLVEQAWDWGQDIQIWINNAGGDVLTGAAAAWSFEQKLDYLWSVDVRAAIRLSRLVGQRMVERAVDGADRCILLMGWDQAQEGMGGDSGEMFAAVKGAVMAFSKSLARSLAPHVRVNCLAPGWIRTSWGEVAPEYWQARACRESLLQRWGMPDDVARMARFLASPASGFITGQVIPINGGFRGPAGD